ncbi:carboxypeptidase C (cathepsin A) [Xanthomonas translucens]
MRSATARPGPVPPKSLALLPMLALALALPMGLCAGRVQAAEPGYVDPTTLGPVALPAPVTTRHRGIFNGQRIDYAATVESYAIAGSDGRPLAQLVSTAYVAASAERNRPVLFAFNGGPIAASTPLHFGLLGPQRLAVPDDLHAKAAGFTLVDNRHSPLDATDIVIFDPASTGYSRVADGVAPASQFSTRADARQLAQLVAAWLDRHGRRGAPVYLLGESYGTLRAPEAATQLKASGIAVDGIVLLGQAANILEYAQRRDNIVSYAVSLPTLAALGWYHGKIDRKGRSLAQFVDEAAAYGRDRYLTTLFLGNRASAQQREEVAQALQGFTGLPAQAWLQADLKVSKVAYARQLFPGQILSASDGRYLLDAQGNSSSIPDYNAVAERYYRQVLKVPAQAGRYSTAMPTSGDFNAWDWDSNKSPFGDYPWVGQLRDLLASNPRCRLLVGNGYYDSQTTLGAMDYLAAQSGLPMQQVRTRYYEGGHMMYTVERSAADLAQDIRQLVRRTW